MKNIMKLYLLSLIFIASPMIAMDGVAIIDMRTAVLSTQAAADAFKALEEDPDYSANLEEAKSIQADRQAMAEKLQKDFETLSLKNRLLKCKEIFKKKVKILSS